MTARGRPARRYTWGDRCLTITEWMAEPEIVAAGIAQRTLAYRLGQGQSVEQATAPRRPGRRAAADAMVDETTRYADDIAAQLCVAAFPEGMDLEEIGEAMGLSRERVRQIEAQALESLRRRFRLAGVRAEDLGDAIALRARREAV